MKYLQFLILCLTFFSCSNSENKENKIGNNNQQLYQIATNLIYEKDTNYIVDILNVSDLYHEEDVNTNLLSKNWVGVFYNTKKVYITKTNLKFDKVPDPIVDEGDQKSGWSVKSDNKDTCVILLTNGDYLIKDEIVFFKAPKELIPKDIVKFNLGEVDYQLVITAKNMNKKENEAYFDYAISLISSKGNEAQKIFFNEGEIEMNPKLMWIGDIDNDNKPDFILDLSVKENVSEIALFLSGKAEKGKLVKLVGVKRTVGC